MSRRPDPALDVRLLRREEVAEAFGVAPDTVSAWARTQRIPVVYTPGGQRRYRETDVRALLEGAVSPPGSSVADEEDEVEETDQPGHSTRQRPLQRAGGVL